MSQGSGRRVLHFAVSGALLGGGAAMGCASKEEPATKTKQVQQPQADDGQGEEPKRTNVGREEIPEPEPEPKRTNVGREEEPKPEPLPKEPDYVNTNHEPEPPPEPPPEPKRVNTAKEPG